LQAACLSLLDLGDILPSKTKTHDLSDPQEVIFVAAIRYKSLTEIRSVHPYCKPFGTFMQRIFFIYSSRDVAGTCARFEGLNARHAARCRKINLDL
jgi:hypothetical protein